MIALITLWPLSILAMIIAGSDWAGDHGPVPGLFMTVALVAAVAGIVIAPGVS